MMKPCLVISIPVVWGVRNVLRSGLADELRGEFHLVFAVPPEGRASLVDEGVPAADVWELERPPSKRFHSWTQRLTRSAHQWRHPTESDEVFARWQRRERSLRTAVVERAFRVAGRTMTGGAMFARLERLEAARFARKITARTWSLVQEHRPVLGLSTSCVIDWERPLFEVMRRMRIPTVTHILSFDNLTSRGYIPLRHFDHFLVWQETMARELVRFYGIPEERITITGTPQFDFHVREEFRWSRARTAEVLGLEPDARYVVYAANHVALTPNEPELVERIMTAASSDERLRGHQWVLRLHPMDTYGRWEQLRERFPQVRFSLPWQHRDEAPYWAVPSAGDIALLGNTLRYADATLNVASTIALDSAIVDTPVICLGFHPRAGSAEDVFYREMHHSHHYRPIMETGAVRLALDPAMVVAQLVEAVEHPEALRAERARLVSRICGTVDGRSVERIVEALRRVRSGASGRWTETRGSYAVGSR